MKNFVIISLLLISFGCGINEIINNLINFKINRTETIQIPEESLIGLNQNIYSQEVTFNLSDQIQNLIDDNGGEDNVTIEQVHLNELDLTIIAPENEDFSFLKNVYFYISGNGIPESQIAFVPEVPANVGNFLEFSVDKEIDLIQLIEQNQLTVRMEAEVIDNPVIQDYTLEVHGEFTVDVNVLEE